MKEKDRLRDFGIKIKIARLKRAMSQEDLAEKVEISRNTISLIETGKINPTILKVIDIAKILDVDIKEITEEI